MTNRITSLQNQRVKEVMRLRNRRGRDEQQRIVIDGAREISRALLAGVQVVEVYAAIPSLSAFEQETVTRASQAGAEVFDVSAAVIDKLAYGDRDVGLVAVARTPERTLDQLTVPENAVVCVLECVEKPGNLGAVVRSADAARISAILVSDGGTDVYNPNAIRASAGTIFSMPVIATTAADALSWLRSREFRILAARVSDGETYWEVSFAGRIAIVLGSESSGLTSVWTGDSVQTISLPQHGISDSLNVSVTAAVLFYEALRQREGTRSNWQEDRPARK